MSSLGYKTLLQRNSSFRALWGGQIISEVGDWFNNIAVLGLAMHLTNSGLVVTAVLLSRTVPAILFGPLAGVVTDRLSKRTVLLAADYSRALLALGFLLVTSRERIWMSYLFGALLTAVSIFFTTAKSASLPDIASKSELMPANAMTGSTTAIVQMLGAALGGLAVEFLGYRVAFIINALSFLGSAAMIYQIRFPLQPTAASYSGQLHNTSFFRDFREGMRYIRSSPIVLGLMLIGVGWATGGGAAQILFSLFAVDVFHAGDYGIGLLYSGAGLGIAAGATWANYRFRGLSFAVTKWILGVSIVMTGGFYCLFSDAATFRSGLLWLALSRVAMGINQVIAMTLLMEVAPVDFRGRTFSTRETVVITTMVLSMLLAGVGQHYAGTRTIGWVSGFATLATGVIWLAANLAGAYGKKET